MIKAMLSSVVVAVVAMAAGCVASDDTEPAATPGSMSEMPTRSESEMPSGDDEMPRNPMLMPRFICAGICIEGACPEGSHSMAGACPRDPSATCCSNPSP